MGRLALGAAYVRTVCVLRAKGIAHGRYPVFFGHLPLIGAEGEISLGHNFKEWSLQFPVQFGAGRGGRLRIGDRVALNQGANIFASTLVDIGDNVRLGDLSAVYDTDFHEVDEGAGIRRAPVTIERNVWIGRSALVLPGVTIGESSVVAAGAIVTSSVSPGCLVAGAPARVLREIRCSPGYVRT